MATKIFVSVSGSLSKDVVGSKKQSVADALGVSPEDVVLVPDGLSVSVIDVPDEMVKARAKADKDAEAEAEKAQKEQEKAGKDQQAVELEAIKAQQAEVARNAPPQPQPATATKGAADAGARKPAAKAEPADYDSWTAEELHAEAAKRDLHGRSGLDKAGLVKALQKSDKDAGDKK